MKLGGLRLAIYPALCFLGVSAVLLSVWNILNPLAATANCRFNYDIYSGYMLWSLAFTILGSFIAVASVLFSRPATSTRPPVSFIVGLGLVAGLTTVAVAGLAWGSGDESGYGTGADVADVIIQCELSPLASFAILTLAFTPILSAVAATMVGWRTVRPTQCIFTALAAAIAPWLVVVLVLVANS